jgi:hypothetical protein
MQQLFDKGAPLRESVDVNDVIREMVVLLRGEAARHEVSIRTELMEDLSQVAADRVQLKQVLMNLMLNGIEAMSDGEGTRQLTITSQQAENGEIAVSSAIPARDCRRCRSIRFSVRSSPRNLAVSASAFRSAAPSLKSTAAICRPPTIRHAVQIFISRSRSKASRTIECGNEKAPAMPGAKPPVRDRPGSRLHGGGPRATATDLRPVR